MPYWPKLASLAQEPYIFSSSGSTNAFDLDQSVSEATWSDILRTYLIMWL